MTATQGLKRWFADSNHRRQLTRALGPVVGSFDGVALDVGGGRQSALASYWTSGVTRLRIDVQHRLRPDVVGDAHCLPFATGAIDAVLVSEVLEHLCEPQAALAEIRRVLRSGGILAGSVPFMSQGVHADPHDYFRYTEDGLRSVLAGFTNIDVVAHGNGVGAAWRALYQGRRWLLPVNPIGRSFGRRPSTHWPEGYTFTARRP